MKRQVRCSDNTCSASELDQFQQFVFDVQDGLTNNGDELLSDYVETMLTKHAGPDDLDSVDEVDNPIELFKETDPKLRAQILRSIENNVGYRRGTRQAAKALYKKARSSQYNTYYQGVADTFEALISCGLLRRDRVES